MNGLVLPVLKLGILNPPLPDANGERWQSRALWDCCLEAWRVTGTRRDFTVHSCKQRWNDLPKVMQPVGNKAGIGTGKLCWAGR